MKLASYVFLAIGAMIAITVHEYSKALISYKLGDPLPKARGRLSLNPMVHFEAIGFICLVVLGYGWGKPVETAAVYYKDRKKGIILTHITPSIINLLVGMLFASLRLIPVWGSWGSAFLLVCAKLNINLALFNIIPVYPLDGAKILALSLTPNQQVKMIAYEKIFQIILIFALASGVVGAILGPLGNVFLLLAR